MSSGVPMRATGSAAVICDRARSEKMRLACRFVRRRVPSLAAVDVYVVPLARVRSTWRDNRLVQLVLGVPQVLREMAAARIGLSGETP